MRPLLATFRSALAEMTTVRRRAARLILFDPDDRVLLFRARPSSGPDEAGGWYLPGGGMHGRESPERTARRELREETGIDAVEIGPVVLHVHGVRFRYGGHQFEQEEWHLVGRLADPRIRRTRTWGAKAGDAPTLRWWTLEELEATGDAIHPRELAEIVAYVLRHGPPAVPWESVVSGP